MLCLANTNSARVRQGDKYNLQKKEKNCLFVFYCLPHYWKKIKMLNIWEFSLYLH